MTILPVVERELRAAARRPWAFWMRFACAAVAILFCAGIFWLGGEWRSAAALGRTMFVSLSWIGFGFCLIAGPVFTADCLSVERREGTLGLLFLTDLKGYDVVLGKLVAASVPALLALLSTLPVLALSILIGGVSLTQMTGMAAVLINALLMSLALGMLVSSFSRDARSAFALTAFLLFALVVVSPYLRREISPAPLSWRLAMTALDPSQALREVVRIGFSPRNPAFIASLAGAHGLAWFSVLFAGRHLRRSYSEIPSSRWGVRRRALGERWTFGNAASRHARRRKWLDRSPLVWLGHRNRLRAVGLWWAVGFGVLGWIALRWIGGTNWAEIGAVLTIGYILQVPIKWLVASDAVHRWSEERHSGALELLLTTPLTTREIFQGLMRGSFLLFAGPVALVVLTELLMILWAGRIGPRDQQTLYFTLVVLGVFVWDLHTLSWVGLYLGLRRRTVNQAFRGTVFRIMTLPWLVFMLLVFLGGGAVIRTAWLSWLLICALNNGLFYFGAREELRTGLRELVTARYDTRKGRSPA